MKRRRNLAEMTWKEAAKAFKQSQVALLPVGSIEQHGPHLPLATDTILVTEMASRLASLTGTIVAPPLYYSYAYTMKDYPGTVNISPAVFQEYVKEICREIARHGLRRILILNGHGGIVEQLRQVSRELHREGILVASALFPGTEELARQIRESPQWRNFAHADEIETSWMLYLKKELVRMREAVKEYPRAPPVYPFVPISLRRYCRSGVFGDATKASWKKGEMMIRHTIRKLRSLVEELIRTPIPKREST